MAKSIIRKIKSGFYNSFCGLGFAFSDDQAFKLEALFTLITVPLALYLGPTPIYKVLLVLSSLFILLVELLNCAIENIIDRIGPEKHPLSRRAKDMGSAAVFLAWIIWFITWFLLLM